MRGKVKNTFSLFWPLLLFPVLYLPYSLLNTLVIVKWLGCGCSENAFNANAFTLLFWGCIAAAVFALSLFRARRMETRWTRLSYLLFMLTASLILVILWYLSMQWR